MDIVNKIDNVYKLINEAEEILDKSIEQEKPINQEATPTNTEEGEGEGEDAGDLLTVPANINGKQIWCATIYRAEKAGPEGESKEFHNVLVVDKSEEFNNPVEFDFWGDEECPDCTAYIDEKEEDVGFVEDALAYNLSIAHLASIVLKLSDAEREELKKQGSDVSFVLTDGIEIYKKFQNLDITSEDIEVFFKGIESNGNGAE